MLLLIDTKLRLGGGKALLPVVAATKKTTANVDSCSANKQRKKKVEPGKGRERTVALKERKKRRKRRKEVSNIHLRGRITTAGERSSPTQREKWRHLFAFVAFMKKKCSYERRTGTVIIEQRGHCDTKTEKEIIDKKEKTNQSNLLASLTAC